MAKEKEILLPKGKTGGMGWSTRPKTPEKDEGPSLRDGSQDRDQEVLLTSNMSKTETDTALSRKQTCYFKTQFFKAKGYSHDDQFHRHPSSSLTLFERSLRLLLQFYCEMGGSQLFLSQFLNFFCLTDTLFSVVCPATRKRQKVPKKPKKHFFVHFCVPGGAAVCCLDQGRFALQGKTNSPLCSVSL